MDGKRKVFQSLTNGNRSWFLVLLLSLFMHGEYSLAFGGGKRSHSINRKHPDKSRGAKKLRKYVVRRKVTKSLRVVRTEKKASSTLAVPLMGSKYDRIVAKDGAMKGTVYYLASGHGGPDPGAIGHYGKQALAEDEYAYDVTLRLARALREHGATVYMIIQDPNDGIRNESVLKLDHDEVTYPNQRIPLNQTMRLRQCTDAVNKLHRKRKEAYQRMVTIHVDSRSKGETIDVFFYHHEQSKVGKRLAQHIHRSFKAGYKRSQPTRHYLGTVSDRSSLYVVRNSHPPTVFIELGNIRNEKDQRRFLLADNRQALANWICAGLQADYANRK